MTKKVDGVSWITNMRKKWKKTKIQVERFQSWILNHPQVVNSTLTNLSTSIKDNIVCEVRGEKQQQLKQPTDNYKTN